MTSFKSLNQWLFSKKADGTIRTRNQAGHRGRFRPLSEQLESRIVLATTVAYDGFTLTFSGDAADTVNLVDDVGTNEVVFNAGNLTNPVVAAGALVTLDNGSLVPGSGYTTVLSYANKPLTDLPGGGTGTGALANFTVTDGVVTAVSVAAGGTGYSVGDTLTVDETHLGGQTPGTAVVLLVNSVTAGVIDPGGLTIQTAGAGYLAEITYFDVPVTKNGGTATDATADITVTDGSVTAVVINDPGTGFVVGDTLSADESFLGGSVTTDFEIEVDSVTVSQFTQDGPNYRISNVSQIVVNLQGNATVLQIGSDWNYDIAVEFVGSAASDVLDLISAVPRNVLITDFGGVDGGFNGDNQNIVFNNLDAVDFNATLGGNNLTLDLVSGSVIDANYDILGAGAGRLTVDGNILTFSGLDDAADDPVALSVTDGALTPVSMLGYMTVLLDNLTPITSTVSGADAQSDGRMFLGFGVQNGADIDFTTPLEAFTLEDIGGADETINIGSSAAVLGAVTIVNGGSEYAVGDILFAVGGVGNTPARIQVDSVDNLGVITAASVIDGGSYAIFPTNPVTSSIALRADTDPTAGSGATFTMSSQFAPMTTPGLFVNSYESGDVINVNSDLLLGGDTVSGDLFLNSGTINLKAASIETTGGSGGDGEVQFGGSVVLGANVTIDAGTNPNGVLFTDWNLPAALNADDAVAQNRTLTINADEVIFDGPIGDNDALADLDVTALGGITFNAMTVNVNDQGSNTVRLEGPVTLGTDIELDLAGNSVVFATSATTIDGGQYLAITSTTGTVTFEGNVGLADALTDLDVEASTINLTAASYIIDAGGSDEISFTGPVVLKNDAVQIDTAFADSSVLFNSTINADDAAGQNRTLEILAGAGEVTFQGGIGSAANGALADLDVTADTITFNNATVRVDDGGSDTVTFTGNVVLGANLSFDTNGASDNNITFDGTVNADDADGLGIDRTLTVDAGTAAATFGGTIGDTEALADLDVTATTINLAADISVNDDDSPAATVVFTGAVQLTGDVTIDTHKTTPNDTSIQFAGTVNGANDLELLAQSGSITFDQAVGGVGALDNLTITSALNVMFHANVTVAAVTGTIAQVAGTGTTTFEGVTTAGDSISVTTKNIIVSSLGLGAELHATTNGITLNAANNIDLQSGTVLNAGGAAALTYGTVNGDSVTLSGSFTSNTASITGTNGISNTLTINYQTASLAITSGGLVFNAGTGAGTNRLIANGSTAIDNFTLSGSVLGEVGNSNVNHSNVHIAQINGGDGADTFAISGGGSASTTINGDAGNDVVTLTAGNNMIISGGADADTFNLAGGTNLTVNGDAGAGPAGNDIFHVTAATGANLNGNDGNDSFTISHTLTGSITGGNNDDFVNLKTIGLNSGSVVSGSIDGGLGNDTLSYADYDDSVVVNINVLATGTLDGNRGNGTGLPSTTNAFDNMNVLVGNADETTIFGVNATATWTITGPGEGTYTSPGRNFSFSGAKVLIGGTGTDTFISVGDAIFEGTIDGGGGNDTIDYSSHTSSRIFTVDGTNQGDIDGFDFVNVEHLKAGSGADTFKFTLDTSKVTGKLDGGGGIDTLDYTGRNLGVNVDLKAGTATNTAGLIVVSGNATIENVTGSAANDVIFGSDLANILDGGAGGDDILSGLAGNDQLFGAGGAASRSILIGGDGDDDLTSDSSSGGDILIGNKTTYDVNKTALTAILKEWNRTTSYESRVARIQGTMGGGLNGSYKFNATTITASTAADDLFGSLTDPAKNWYILGIPGTLTGKGPNEVETRI